MPNAQLSIVEEVEAAIKIGSAEKSLDSIRRVTDLFLSSASGLNTEQIELFDEVLERLINDRDFERLRIISARMALAELSAQLAPWPERRRPLYAGLRGTRKSRSLDPC